MRGKLRQRYDRSMGHILPLDRTLGLLCCLLLNCLVYWGAMLLNGEKELLDAATVLDELVPCDSRWVIVYVGAFGFWAVNYILMAQGENWYEIFAADATAKLICGVIFLMIPTTNVRPQLGTGFFDCCLRLIYGMDRPTNLFPSIHCLESWICWRGIQNRWDIPGWYRDLSCVFAILVCISTLLTKQHVIADVFGGILLGEGMLYLSQRFSWRKWLKSWMEGCSRLIFGA